MKKSRLPLFALALCQGLLLTNNVVNITMNGLVGFDLAAQKQWATLPLSAYTLATALAVFPAAMWMQRMGRRLGFALGCLLGLGGAVLCAAAVWTQSFWLLVLGNFVAGGYNAFGQFYRFAAAELVPPGRRAQAVATVVAGGLAGAFLGPEGSRLTKDALHVPYLGAYLFLAVSAVLATITVFLISFADAPVPASSAARPRALAEIASTPQVRLAVLASACGYAVMNYLMTSTPLAMVAHHHSFDAAAFVIQWHAVAMFAPSLVVGPVIARYGPRTMMAAGAALAFLSVALTQLGDMVPVFWVALVLLGLAWNLLYISGTAALAACWRPEERFKVQGANDLVVFGSSAAASVMSGVLLQMFGWPSMALATLPLLILLAVGIAALRGDPATRSERPKAAVPTVR